MSAPSSAGNRNKFAKDTKPASGKKKETPRSTRDVGTPPGSSTNSSGGESVGSLAMSVNRMDFVSPPKDRPLRGVAPSPYPGRPDAHDRGASVSAPLVAKPAGRRSKKDPNAKKGGPDGKGVSRQRSRSADDAMVDKGARTSGEPGGKGKSGGGGGGEGGLRGGDGGGGGPGALESAAKLWFGEQVGPVVCAHLHLQGVDTEDDLRYVDYDDLMRTAETSGLLKVQLAKLGEWVKQAQQVSGTRKKNVWGGRVPTVATRARLFFFISFFSLPCCAARFGGGRVQEKKHR